jgi:tRNA 2-thiouridine synthesizing protein A
MLNELDLTGLKCPLPALKTRKALTGFTGGVLHVITTDPMAQIDIPHLVREMGLELVSQEPHGVGHRFAILKTN